MVSTTMADLGHIFQRVSYDHDTLNLPSTWRLASLLRYRPELATGRAAIYASLVLLLLYAVFRIITLILSLFLNIRRARATGLPVKVVPFPPGTFSFFLSQICQRLGLLRPGSTLHRWLNMGRPVGYDIHKEMGDVFVTANPYGLTLIVADPKVIAHINSKREQFPKPPNHAEIINIYGRNAINTDGEVWRLHRRMNGHVSSERIQGLVWTEGIKQAKMMMESWHVANITSRGDDSNSMLVPDPLDDFLRLSLHVITGSAYGMPLAWNEDPPCTVSTQLSYRHSLEQVTAHLLPIFMIPHWVLRLAIPGTRWSRAWDAYNAFGGYMKGLVNRTSAKMKSGEIEEETILTVLLDASRVEDELVGRTLTESEVLGNSFVMLIAGHEATADTLLYATLLLAQYPAFQEQVLGEIDRIHEQVKVGGRVQPEYEVDFGEAKWLLALMYETLRLYTPTGATTKLSVIDQPIVFKGTTHLIPKGTRISVNGTGVHFNPEVWGPNPKQFNPYRWLGEEYGKSASTKRSEAPTSPPSPGLEVFKPARGTYLPFSEGARGCPGKKYATVEFVAVLVTILRDHRVSLEEGWSAERVEKLLRGRKAGAFTLQPPEAVPLRFVRRSVSS